MNSAPRPVLRMVVLAAGFSRRLGTPKALARVRGMSLIRHTVRLLTPFGLPAIVVVLAPRASRTRVELRVEARARRLTFVDNPRRAEGLSSSVRRGLLQSRYSAGVLLLPVDLARLDPRDIARLILRWSGARRRVVARRVDGGGGGGGSDRGGGGGPSAASAEGAAPLIVPRWLYPRALGIAGDVGLKEMVRRLPRAQVALVNLPSAGFDVDTPRDLDNARRRAAPARQPRAPCTRR